MLKHTFSASLPRGETWPQFIDKYYPSNSGIDNSYEESLVFSIK